LTSDSEHRFAGIDGDHRAGRCHIGRQRDGNVANPTADIEQSFTRLKRKVRSLPGPQLTNGGPFGGCLHALDQ
jgi:hypothetical protein